MNKNEALILLCILFGIILKYNIWPNESNPPQTQKKKAQQKEIEEEVLDEFDDGLQEVSVYNRKTDEERIIYRKQYEMERRTRNIKFIQKTNSPSYSSPEAYDDFVQRESRQKKELQQFIQADNKRDEDSQKKNK